MSNSLQIVPIACLSDNYAYLLVSNGTAAVVDPSETAPVLEALDKIDAKLEQIWLTHHHWDHVGGIDGICEQFGSLSVFGSQYDLENQRISHQTKGLVDGDRFSFAGSQVDILSIPGHTLGAIAFVIEGNLFSGDTLFLGGCGRVFEGTMKMMSESLSKLRELPTNTRVWCGHEYTVSNLRFARTVEPENASVAEALERAVATRERGDFTVPGLLEIEVNVNPFLRFDDPDVAQGRDPVSAFTAIREAKDRF